MAPQPQEQPRRQERAQRILDAAASLILRWGYNKTTIDDIAQQASVAKGTIYLHWKTREALFAALMKREKAALTADFGRRASADPAGATLRGIFKHSALALMERPLLKAVLLRDINVIGKLVHSEQSNTANSERLAGFRTYLEFLREHALVRTDISIQAQMYTMSAIFMGFFLIAPLMPDELTLSDAEIAELLADAIHRTLEVGNNPDASEQAALAEAFTHYLNHNQEIIQEQLRQELQ